MSGETKFTPWLAIYDRFAPVVSIGNADDCPFFILKRHPDDEATVKAIINKAGAAEDMYEALGEIFQIADVAKPHEFEWLVGQLKTICSDAQAKARGESQ